ncbi:putative maltose permease [Aspergillus flavus]|uniref:Maltose permease n=1 Tax=Aspergillus flavus (strain ATCC 200026 / FGSC A1120 / IAM 13836 / NRRL 3357 / JCM 12722 / SRRC 167) TaxID=332952 RepID=A0A7U2MYH6_ASPFN|nr:putative maltose permease [Aspergillus flavus]
MYSFSKARAWSIVLSTAVVMEGYDLLLVTSFFASPPWTKQYGTLQLNDKYELSAAWQTVLYNGPAVGEILELCLNGLVVERIGYRRTKGRTFEHDGSTGIIKVPGPGHEITTDRVKTKISFLMLRMGIEDQYWVVATRYQGTGGSKSKEGDQGFLPPTRQPVGTLATGVCPFPTLVIETGVSESLPKLREDVLWWFNHSRGDVRIVLVLCIRKRAQQPVMLIEKWQLAPPTTPRPLTRRALQQLQQQVPYPMPPQVQQQPSSQSAYCAQSIEITPQAVTGPSLILPFLAVFGRPPVAPEADLILTTAMLASCIQHL